MTKGENKMKNPEYHWPFKTPMPANGQAAMDMLWTLPMPKEDAK